MRNLNLIEIARDLLEIHQDLPFRFKIKGTREYDFDMYDFPQVWGTTALGFDGIGGCAMTIARTYVFIPHDSTENCFVYFAGRFAYEVPYSELFMKDVIAKAVAPVYEIDKYTKTVVDNNEP